MRSDNMAGNSGPDRYNGVLNVYKEAGYTSQDVVSRLRGILHQKKIGHTGTLDPAAVGVLPVCLGNATKLVESMMDKTKEYRCVLVLGERRDTEDTEGELLEKYTGVPPTEEAIREAVAHFTGSYEQVPPMYSAIRQNGKRLYELAREGITVERKARPVTIDELEILGKARYPRTELRIVCSRGTYIRALCRDIGEHLGCGGCMEGLVRTRSGIFTIEEAYTLDQIRDSMEGLIPTEFFFRELPVLHVRPGAEKLLQNGNPLTLQDVEEEDIYRQDQEFRLYLPGEGGVFRAVYFKDGALQRIVPKYMM